MNRIPQLRDFMPFDRQIMDPTELTPGLDIELVQPYLLVARGVRNALGYDPGARALLHSDIEDPNCIRAERFGDRAPINIDKRTRGQGESNEGLFSRLEYPRLPDGREMVQVILGSARVLDADDITVRIANLAKRSSILRLNFWHVPPNDYGVTNSGYLRRRR